MIKISVSQALLLVIDNYQKKLKNEKHEKKSSSADSQKIQEKLHLAEKFYLSGVSNKDDDREMSKLFDESWRAGILTGCEISDDPKVITEDPSRRYFETHLAYETLSQSIKQLTTADMERFQKSVEKFASNAMVDSVTLLNYVNNIFDLEKTKYSESLDFSQKEYRDSFFMTQSSQYFDPSLFSKEDRRKMEIMLKLTYLSTFVDSIYGSNIPLNLYNKGMYASKARGRVGTATSKEMGRIDNVRGELESKLENEIDDESLVMKREFEMQYRKNIVNSDYLGIMKSKMPAPLVDIVQQPLVEKNKKEYIFTRIPELSHFVSDSEWAKQNFAKQVHPFVSSISGTMLMLLKLLAVLHRISPEEFLESQQLKHFLTSFTSMMLYLQGGHSLNEFLSVLAIPEVKMEFKFIKGFEKINDQTLFYENNRVAFSKSLQDTISYNNVIINKQKTLESMKGAHKLFSKSSTKKFDTFDKLAKPLLEVVHHSFSIAPFTSLNTTIDECYKELAKTRDEKSAFVKLYDYLHQHLPDLYNAKDVLSEQIAKLDTKSERKEYQSLIMTLSTKLMNIENNDELEKIYKKYQLSSLRKIR